VQPSFRTWQLVFVIAVWATEPASARLLVELVSQGPVPAEHIVEPGFCEEEQLTRRRGGNGLCLKPLPYLGRLKIDAPIIRHEETIMMEGRVVGDEAAEIELSRRGRAVVLDGDDGLQSLPTKTHNLPIIHADVSSKLSLRGIARDPVGAKGQVESDQNQNGANRRGEPSYRCPPGRVSGCVRRFPLGAQIGIALVIAGLALALIVRALRPLGLLVVTRRDALQSVGAALLGGGLLWLSFRVWMMGG
jgi:hypothetical protein